MLTTRKLVIGLTLASLILAGSRCQADLVAYDSFSDTPVGGQLLGSPTSSMGFSDAWHPGGFSAGIFSNYTIASGSLSDGSLATTGNSISTAAQSTISGLSRDLTNPLGAAGTTDYISVLLRPDGAITGGTFNNYYGLYLNASTSSGNLSNDVFIGKPGNGPINDYDVETRGGTNQFDSGVAAVTGQTVLLVLRADFTAGLDNFTLYVNPPPGGTEPSSGTVKSDTDVGTVSSLTLYSTGAFSIDEIRIGTTYADVVPSIAVPEPSSAALAATGILCLLAAPRLLARGRKPCLPA
jgi:hypothetical protein